MKKTTRVSNQIGIRNLCEVASLVLRTMPVNAATTFTVRTLMREAVNKSNPSYRGNDNKKNVRFVSAAAVPHLGQKGPVVAEHLIPISVLLNSRLYVAMDPVVETDDLVRLVKQYTNMALISVEEDALLRKHRLQSKMPANWDGADLFARYRAVGIKVFPIEEIDGKKLTGANGATCRLTLHAELRLIDGNEFVSGDAFCRQRPLLLHHSELLR